MYEHVQVDPGAAGDMSCIVIVGKLGLFGVRSLSDEAAKAMAKPNSEVVLTGLMTISESAAATLRANQKVKSSPKLKKP